MRKCAFPARRAWPKSPAVGKNSPSPRNHPNSGSRLEGPADHAFTATELVVVIAVIALLAMVLLVPALRRARARAQRITCAGNLMQVGLSFKTWALDNTNSFPMDVPVAKGGTRELAGAGGVFRHFQVLSNELATPFILVCPADRRTRARDFTGLSNTNVSYFVGLDAEESNPQMILTGDYNLTNGTPLTPERILVLTSNSVVGWTDELHRQQGNIGLADGSVQQVSSSRLTGCVSLGGTNRLAMP